VAARSARAVTGDAGDRVYQHGRDFADEGLELRQAATSFSPHQAALPRGR